MGNELKPDPAADLVIRVEKLIAQHVKADATGLAPAVIGYHLFGFDDAARAVVALFQPQMEAAEGLLHALEEMDRYDAMAEGYYGSPAYHKTQEAIRNARDAGLGRD